MNGIRILIEENPPLLTNYTGHVTFFLVKLVVSVNGLSFFLQLKQYHYYF